MTIKIARRDTLKLIAGASAVGVIGAPAIVRAADTYPSRPITLVNPNPPSGYNDALCRVLSPPMSKVFGQPVTVINIPGASEMLGHIQYLKEPDDGYYIMCSSVSFIPLNILLQGASFKLEDFQMVNLSARDYTMMATSVNNTKLKKIEDVVEALKKDPSSVSVGAPRASTDNINMVLFMRSIGVDVSKVRVVTFESGGTVRTAVLGGVVDVGFSGGEGFEPLADQITPLMVLDSHDHEGPFEKVRTISEAKVGDNFDAVPGSLRGFCVSAKLKADHPDVFSKIVDNMEKVYKDPDVIKKMNTQSLTPTWYGPDDSQAVYMKTAQLMTKYVDLLKKGKSKG